MPAEQPHVLGAQPVTSVARFARAVGGTALALGSIYAVAGLLDWLFAENAGEVVVGSAIVFVSHAMAYGLGAAHGEQSGAANAREQTCGAFLWAFNASLPGDFTERPITVAATIERLKQREQAKIAAILVEGATPLLERMHRGI